MIGRLIRDRGTIEALRRIDRPAAAVLAVAQAVVAAVGWFVDPVWLAVAVAVQLAFGSIGAIRVMGPARQHLGLARYAVPAMAGIAATLFGRLIPGGLSLLLIPIVAVLLWSVTYLELRAERGIGGRTMRDLLLTLMVFGGVAGLLGLFGIASWPTPLLLVAPLVLPAAIQSAALRGVHGAEGVGQGLVHVLAVVQVGAAAILLDTTLVATSALMALAFYTWSGAADSLGQGASRRAVIIEFGALVAIGLVVGLLLARG